MLNPLGTMLIMTFVFSNLFKSVQSYPVYILSGLIAWNFFAQGTNAAMSGLVWGGSLMQRIYLPRTIFGVSAIGTALVNLLLSIIPLLLVMVITQTTIPDISLSSYFNFTAHRFCTRVWVAAFSFSDILPRCG
jgi:ABC-type polysaccharide/polyol phosphate export permease